MALVPPSCLCLSILHLITYQCLLCCVSHPCLSHVVEQWGEKGPTFLVSHCLLHSSSSGNGSKSKWVSLLVNCWSLILCDFIAPLLTTFRRFPRVLPHISKLKDALRWFWKSNTPLLRPRALGLPASAALQWDADSQEAFEGMK